MIIERIIVAPAPPLSAMSRSRRRSSALEVQHHLHDVCHHHHHHHHLWHHGHDASIKAALGVSRKMKIISVPGTLSHRRKQHPVSKTQGFTIQLSKSLTRTCGQARSKKHVVDRLLFYFFCPQCPRCREENFVPCGHSAPKEW